MEIFLIEDDAIYADYVKKLLGQNPELKITRFASVEEYQAAKPPMPNAFIVDYKLPGKSGIEFYEEIKPLLNKDTKLIMMSAIDDGAMVLDFIKKGVRDYVIKDESVIDSLRAILEGNDDYYMF